MSRRELVLLDRSLRWLQVALTLAVVVAGLTVVGRVGLAVVSAAVDIPGRTFVGSVPVPLPAVERIEETPSTLVDGVTIDANKPVTLVLENPTAGQAALAMLGPVPSALVYFALFLLLYGLVRSARRDEVFTDSAAARVRLLGGTLIAGALAAKVAEAVLQGLLSRTVTVGRAFEFDLDFPGSAVISGLGLLAVAAVLRRGTVMRKDLEGTV